MSGDGPASEVKSKLDIVQIIGEYIQLRKAGVNFKAPCPFHNEKDPSFYVSPERQSWHCFGCNEGGDVFSFVMRMDGMDFPEALRHLAERAGVELKGRMMPEPGQRGIKERLYLANDLASRFWHEILLRSSLAEAARGYCFRRKLNDEAIDDFAIGYAPESWDSLTGFLRKKGFREDEMIRAGLAISGQRGAYDRFRNRLMFPIRDAQGRVVGFTGRVMPLSDGSDPPPEKVGGKYVNTPETDIYRKSEVLFALDRAKSDIRKSGFAVVVEGNMDAVSSHQAGVRNVVASSGTAFTIEQLTRLKRLTDRLVLSFDADAAGETAARRSIDACVATGFEVKVLRLPPDAGKDPDDCIRKDPEIWKRAIAEAVPFMQWYFDLALQRLNPDDSYAKRRTSLELLSEVAKLPDGTERHHWVRRLFEMFGTQPRDLVEELNQLIRKSKVSVKTMAGTANLEKPTDRNYLLASHFVGLVLAWPDSAESAIAAILPEDLADDYLAGLYRDYIVFYNERRTSGQANWPAKYDVHRLNDPKGSESVAKLELLAEKEFGELTEDGRRQALANIIGELKKLRTDRRKTELAAHMAQAERVGDAARIRDIQRQIEDLII
jgi:DNA primase